MIWPFGRRKTRHANKIRITPPAPQSDRHGLAIVLIARNEATHIRDWLAFHALAGVRAVILYDNMSTDDTVKIARAFKGMEITVIPWQFHARTIRPEAMLDKQVLAYCHAISTFGGEFSRMAFIDTDEFIVPTQTDTIPQALTRIGDFPNISMPWIMFGHAGHDRPPQTAVPLAYDMRASTADGPLLNFKCIVDPCGVTQVGVHQFETNDMGNKTANTKGQVTGNRQRKTPEFVTTELLQLNHYYLKSRADTKAKIDGGDAADTPIARRANSINTKAALIEANPVRDDSAMLFLARHGIHTAQEFRNAFQDHHA